MAYSFNPFTGKLDTVSPSASTTVEGTVKLTGDLGGTAASPTVVALHSATTSVNVSSATAPSSGQVLTATSGTAATWQTPTSGDTWLKVQVFS